MGHLMPLSHSLRMEIIPVKHQQKHTYAQNDFILTCTTCYWKTQ